jgi:signal transduction histidine kinase
MLFKKTEVDLADIVVRVVTLLRPIATERSLILATDVSLDRRHTVLGDDARLMQVLTNVISNALKYTKEGTITVALEKARGRYEIRVKDTGMGISADDQKRLFAPYFRVASPDMDTTTGTGLGMWITKRMIEEMEGTIDVESIKGVGTHIVMTFKAA